MIVLTAIVLTLVDFYDCISEKKQRREKNKLKKCEEEQIRQFIVSNRQRYTFRSRLLSGYWIFFLYYVRVCVFVCSFSTLFLPQIHAGFCLSFSHCHTHLIHIALVSLSIIIMTFEVFTTLKKVHWLKLFSLVSVISKLCSHSGIAVCFMWTKHKYFICVHVYI